ncbi:tetratricopeptide repeat protein [Bacillus sp. 1P06AnD]|uniref:tetratricopeptide repeat protein n=1 Tax=Bacillus sp. 1P06AnD TaxID=3132208 RepID=UPI0039A331E5
MKNKKETGNIIPFPGLEKRLVEKGLDSIVEKRFKEAQPLLSEALQFNPEDYNARFGLIVASLEMGQYLEARQHCEFLLKNGLGDYFKTVEMYIMILLQLQEYEEMEGIIAALLDEGHVPTDKEEHFQSMLEFSRKMASQIPHEEEEPLFSDEGTNLADLSLQEQMLLVQQWKDGNIRIHIPEIREYLCSEKGHPFIKTIMLLLLREQEVQGDFEVHKWSELKTVSPLSLDDVHERPFYREITSLLEDVLGSMDPSLAQLAIQLVERQQFILYPMEPEQPFGKFAAAYHMMSLNYFGTECDMDEIAGLYGCGEAEALDALAFIEQIEEISSI